MESLLVLAGLVIFGIPIVLFLLVIGARRRVSVLERSVEQLQRELSLLHEQVSTPHVTASVGSSATAPSPSVVPPSGPAESAALRSTDKATTVSEPEPERLLTSATEPEQPPPGQGREEYDPGPATIPGYGPVPGALATPYQAIELPEPPAWLRKAKDWLFGGNLVAKGGLLILFFGVSFLLKYAAARVSVPIELRLAGIALADIALLVWGWRIRVTRPSISLPVQGSALGILMLVTFGAYRLYGLIPGGLTFGLLFALTAFTCLLAVLQDAIWLAIFGIAGGFAAPILVSTGSGSHIGLFSYYALLNAGIVAIALKRSWRLLNLLGFVFTFAISTAWGVLRYRPEDYLSAQGFLILFFVFYVGIAILYASRQAPRLRHYVDGTLVFGTPLLAFGLQYGLVQNKPFGLAYSALALGLFYIGLTLALWRRRGSSLQLLIESFLALGIVFGTLAVPFALDGRWTSAAWALEGAGIVWVGLRQKQKLAWAFGVLVQAGAWVSFVASVSGMNPGLAAQSNLWLGFLLLAGAGFVMAMNFRREARRGIDDDVDCGGDDQDVSSGPIFTLLSTVFLGFAAVWLLSGAWSEIYLRADTQAHTLYVLSGMGVAGILGLIARRLDWSMARYFALAPQLLAGLALLWVLGFDRAWMSHAYSGNLFDSAFLGSLLIALGAGFSGLSFYRLGEGGYQRISRILLGWSAFWWFVYVLGSLNGWGQFQLARLHLFTEAAYPLVHPVYGLLLASGTFLFARLARRLDWPDLRWLACAVWPGLLYTSSHIFLQLVRSPTYLPPWPVWAALLALWLAGEWLLREAGREGWLLPERHPRALRLIHTLRTAGPWLLLWPLGHNLVTLGLQADTAEQAVLLAESGWFASGSWARYLPVWAMMAYVALLIPRARDERWPTAPISGWYRDALIPLGALCALGLVAMWNLTQNGLMEPLPYLPILNPLDLSTGFAALLAVASWRLHAQSAQPAHSAHSDAIAPPGRLVIAAAVAAYLWFNLMLLRTAAHYLDIAYQFDPLFRSQFVQAMLSLVWSATALVLMRFAAKRVKRLPWMAGAGLLVLVVAKLFFIDLSNVGGIERIISFLGVGVLMLAIGYLAPFPSEKSTVAE
ncbi:putative membrane protein [Candidatus Propionivibrio aalborgensis]|uniref:Putative membrane protein n=1 Tax=Candidatus Propionivibrio aalborgensis TaxID=1860101 RepID=A0A1A8Y0T8_9RHOO|nr:DUF2339 domain-containing protein [Candidatus Propionivibrio aalborgensis]SBT10754.1 putative membrane protein [Candidatus Propionivibrio aalborgensis]